VSAQVIFRFGESSEIRYVDRLPELGERVEHQGATWEVVSVEKRRGHSATCVLSLVVPSLQERTLAQELLERVERDQVAWNLPRPPTTSLAARELTGADGARDESG
jgi:hypothetical protein